MSCGDPQLKIRMPAALKRDVERVARAAGRSVTAEVTERLRASLVTPVVVQGALAFAEATPTADQYAQAACVFAAAHDVATRMGIGGERARLFACDRTRRATGIDWRAELAAARAATKSLPRAALEWGETEPIQRFIQGRDRVAADDLCRSAISRPPTCRATRMRVAEIMRSLGWRRHRTRIDGVRSVVYLPVVRR